MGVINTQTVEGLLEAKQFRTQPLVQAAAATTTTLLSTSEHTVIFTGTTAGQVVKLQDATTISVGFQQIIQNNTTKTITLQDNAAGAVLIIPAGQRVLAVLQVAGTAAGTWTISVTKNSVQDTYTTTVTSAGTVSLTSTSTLLQLFTGSTQGQIVALPDATTLVLGQSFRIHNDATVSLAIRDSGGTTLHILEAYQRLYAVVTNVGSAAGTWSLTVQETEVPNPSAHAYLFDDFVGGTAAGSHSLGWLVTTNGAGSGVGLGTPTANNVGVITLATGTNSAGRTAINTSIQALYFSGGLHIWQAYVKIDTLSTGAQQYKFYAGFGDNGAAGDMVDGVYFSYVENEQSGNWALNTADASTRTQSSSAVAATTNWVKLRIEVNTAGTRADFFINDVNVGNITSNIPVTDTAVFGHLFKVQKSNGGTTRFVSIDYMMHRFFPTTAR